MTGVGILHRGILQCYFLFSCPTSGEFPVFRYHFLFPPALLHWAMAMLRKIQRVGKRASKFQYTATYQSVVVECTAKDNW